MIHASRPRLAAAAVVAVAVAVAGSLSGCSPAATATPGATPADPARQRTLLAGQTGAATKAVIAGFDDGSEVVASLGRGWYLAWWPGTAFPGGVGAVDSRRLVIASLDL